MARLKPTFASIQARAHRNAQRLQRRFTQTQNTQGTREPAQLCAWFALCARRATATRDHPVLGAVPICRQCDAKVEWLEAGGSGSGKPAPK